MKGERESRPSREKGVGSYLGTVVGGRRGVEIGPAGGGDIDFGFRGGKELWASGGKKGGIEL